MEMVNNPFWTLGATTRDDRRRIMELAEEKSLVSDEAMVREATAILTNPRRRLAAEVGWLPGLGPTRISEAISIVQTQPVQVRTLGNLPNLARANLLAEGLKRGVQSLTQRDMAVWIVDLANAYDGIEAEETRGLLNEERTVSRFPAIADQKIVQNELDARRTYYRHAINSALDELASSSLVDVITTVVEQVTNHGAHQAPILIDDLVDSFEVNAQEILEAEHENIRHLSERIRIAAKTHENDEKLNSLAAQIEQVVQNWDRFAQPIQVSALSRGLSHKQSLDLASEIRTLAIDLFNEHDLLDISRKLTDLQREVFAEVDRIVEKSEEDAATLDEISEQRIQESNNAKARADSWRREITYGADVGVMFKQKLKISPDGVQWKGSEIPLEQINRVRWGGTQHSVNGVSTGTTYTIFVGGNNSAITIELRRKSVYSEFIDRLWKAVGMRLLQEMLEGLRSGKRYPFGSALVADDGITLERRRLFVENEFVHCKWKELVIGNRPGAFYIAKANEKKSAVELGYEDTDNVHLLEAAMRVLWKKGNPRLSDLLDKA